MNFKQKQLLICSFLFLSAYSYSSVSIELSRDSYLFSESKNSQLFKLNVILKDDDRIIFKEKLSRSNKIFYKDLEEKKYSFIIEFDSYLKGKTENKYIVNLTDSGLYRITLGKKNVNFSSSLVKAEGKIYAYRINDLHFIPSISNNKFHKRQDNSETLKTALRNLSLLYEQKVITKQEYLERRQSTISKYSK